MAQAVGRQLARPQHSLIPPAASRRLLAVLSDLPAVRNLVIEHEVGHGVVGYAYAVGAEQLSAADRDLAPLLRQWATRPDLQHASPFVYLEYDTDQDEFASPHIFFRILRFDGSTVPEVGELLLDEEEPARRGPLRQILQRLLNRLPRGSRSGFLGRVIRPQLRELRCQFPIDTAEVRALLEDIGGFVSDDFEFVLRALERARVRHLNLQLGLGDDGIAGRVGIELGVARWCPPAPAVWRRIVGDLVNSETANTFGEQLDDWWGRGDDSISHARWTHFKLATGRHGIELKHYLWLQTLEGTDGMDEPKHLG